MNKLFEAGGFDATRTGYCRLTQMVPTDIILGAIDRLEASGIAASQPEWSIP